MVEKTENGLSLEANVHLLSRTRLRNLVLVTFLFLCFFALISGASAANFNSSSTNAEIQAFLSNTTTTDNEVVFSGGTYNQITGLTVSRSVNISSTGQVNIESPSAGTLFTITAPNVKIVNLNISAYNLAINSNQGNLSVIGCNMSTIDRSIHLSGASLTGVLLENNTIISSVNSISYGAVYVNATDGSVVNIAVKGNNILGNGTSDSVGVRFDVVRCNNTLFFENNNITGRSYGVYLDAYNNSNNTITITNNNITGTYGVYLDAYTSNNNITITNNNITGTSGNGVYLDAYTSNNNITITNNNITGTSAYGVVLDAYTNSNNNITITNNNITGTSSYGVVLVAYTSNNTITITNNNITGTSGNGVYLGAYTNSNNTITITNNNITGTSAQGVYLYASTNSNNNITITNNNITGPTGVALYAYTNSNNTITITNNNITGNNYGVDLSAYSSNNTITITNNNITGTSAQGVYLVAYTSNNTITITNNNITGTYGVDLYAYTNSNNNITITNNNITGKSGSGVYLYAETSNNNITITNNNITGTSAQGVYLVAYTNSNNTITITNNNITGTSAQGVYLDAHTNSNNTITITNNNITGTSGNGVYLSAYTNSNNTITITNNNITGTSNYGVYLEAYTSNNTITITNNNITGTSGYGVELRAETSNNTISFTDNNIRGASYGMYVDCNNAEFSGLSVVNNTLNATNSGGIGIGFVNLNPSDLSDILVSGNNIFAGTTTGSGVGISFGTGLVSVDNVTINYNRVLAGTGLSIPSATSGSVNANLNWWGVNAPRITGMTLDNWFVMELSANTFWTIVNASVNQSGLVNLTYKFLLFTNSSNSTSVVGFANLPHFLVDIFWNSTSVSLYNVTGVDAFGTYSYAVTVNPGGNYTLTSIGDRSNVRLNLLSANDVNVTITKTANVTGNVVNGQTITYNITVTNNGLTNATNVTVIEQYLSSLIFVSANTGGAGTYNNATGIWTIGNLSNGSSVTLILTFRVNATTNGNSVNVTNIANLTTNQTNFGTNVSNATITVVPGVNLTVNKTANVTGNVVNGQTITYNITVRNNGPDNATNVRVNEKLPASLIYVNNSQGSAYDPITGIWTIGNLSNGATVTLIITVRVNGTGNISNSINVTADQGNINNDTNGTNITENITVVPGVNLTVSKTSNVTGNVVNGQTITYTIVVTNHGPNDATNVVITEKLPTALLYQGYTATAGTYNNGTGLWTIANLANGANATLIITVKVNGTGNIGNTVNVTADQDNINNDTNGTNITENITVVPGVNLTVSKTSNVTGTVSKGQTITYTIVVTNHGPDSATGVVVTEKLPNSLVYVGGTPSTGTYDPTTGLWTIGNLANGQTTTLVIVVKINGTGNISNSVNITADQPNINGKTNNTNTTANIVVESSKNTSLTTTAEVSDDGKSIVITSRLTDEDGNPIAGKVIKFYVNGKYIGHSITDNNGIARIVYASSSLKNGKYTITAVFEGDSEYSGYSDTIVFEVNNNHTDPTNETNKTTITGASMKKTGVPIIAMAMILLLAVFSAGIIRKDEQKK